MKPPTLSQRHRPMLLLALVAWAGLALGCRRAEKEEKRARPPGAGDAKAAGARTQARPIAAGATRVWRFDKDPAGSRPGSIAEKVGRWRVVRDEAAPSPPQALEQQRKSSKATFNVALVKAARYRDLDLAVQLRAVAGKVDQGGGLVWRARDGRNYYVTRYNPLEDNLRVYTVKKGRRRMLRSAKVRADHRAWHTLRVQARGRRIRVFFDGKPYLDVRDETFPGAGRIGLWTKADAVTRFDTLTVTAAATLDPATIGAAVGTRAKVAPGGVVRVAWARTDVPVKIDTMAFSAPAGLTSWAGFAPSPRGAMLMGDTVVFQDEVDAAMDAAFAGSLEVTALHNHFFFDEPKVYFMHIGGHGDPGKLARGVRAVWEAIRAVRRRSAVPARRFPGPTPRPGRLDRKEIARILGHRAQVNGGVVKVTIGRAGTMHGVRLGGSMGLTTWAAFSGSDKLAAVDGDFIMTAAEVQPVLRALRRAGLHVVALHNHMVGGKPFFYFTHFWGKGGAASLARGLRAALTAQRNAASSVSP